MHECECLSPVVPMENKIETKSPPVELSVFPLGISRRESGVVEGSGSLRPSSTTTLARLGRGEVSLAQLVSVVRWSEYRSRRGRAVGWGGGEIADSKGKWDAGS